MKRLIKKADNTKIIINSINNLVQEGRGVLKRIESYKFKLTQSEKMMQGNDALLTKLRQKEKILDSASAQIYGIIFDLENFDLTPNYSNEQLSLSTVSTETETNNDINKDTSISTNTSMNTNTSQDSDDETKPIPATPKKPGDTDSSMPSAEDSENELEENIKETDETDDDSNEPDDDADTTTKDGLKMQGNA